MGDGYTEGILAGDMDVVCPPPSTLPIPSDDGGRGRGRGRGRPDGIEDDEDDGVGRPVGIIIVRHHHLRGGGPGEHGGAKPEPRQSSSTPPPSSSGGGGAGVCGATSWTAISALYHLANVHARQGPRAWLVLFDDRPFEDNTEVLSDG